MTTLKYDWIVSGQGTVEVPLDEIDDLTPAQVEEYATIGVEIRITDEHDYLITLRPHLSPDDLRAALAAEKKLRD
jgi:hypothetical protein